MLYCPARSLRPFKFLKNAWPLNLSPSFSRCHLK